MGPCPSLRPARRRTQAHTLTGLRGTRPTFYGCAAAHVCVRDWIVAEFSPLFRIRSRPTLQPCRALAGGGEGGGGRIEVSSSSCSSCRLQKWKMIEASSFCRRWKWKMIGASSFCRRRKWKMIESSSSCCRRKWKIIEASSSCRRRIPQSTSRQSCSERKT